MKKLQIKYLFIAFFFMASSLAYAQQTDNNQSVKLYNGTYDDFLREVKKQKKVAVIDFWASWCAPCKKMDKETFTDAHLAAYLNQNTLVYRVNIDTIDGQEIAHRFLVESFPSIIVFSKRGKQLDNLKGFYPANYLLDKLQGISENKISVASL